MQKIYFRVIRLSFFFVHLQGSSLEPDPLRLCQGIVRVSPEKDGLVTAQYDTQQLRQIVLDARANSSICTQYVYVHVAMYAHVYQLTHRLHQIYIQCGLSYVLSTCLIAKRSFPDSFRQRTLYILNKNINRKFVPFE